MNWSYLIVIALWAVLSLLLLSVVTDGYKNSRPLAEAMVVLGATVLFAIMMLVPA